MGHSRIGSRRGGPSRPPLQRRRRLVPGKLPEGLGCGSGVRAGARRALGQSRVRPLAGPVEVLGIVGVLLRRQRHFREVLRQRGPVGASGWEAGCASPQPTSLTPYPRVTPCQVPVLVTPPGPPTTPPASALDREA
uniref:Uncharacterized protein n=1 Tax=Macaca fascicularis TaxID=9541 RepID=Q95LJ6_MACFA|nr:hypothetical protein [Macaca fascicularis]